LELGGICRGRCSNGGAQGLAWPAVATAARNNRPVDKSTVSPDGQARLLPKGTDGGAGGRDHCADPMSVNLTAMMA
jgi:hypothetical protein